MKSIHKRRPSTAMAVAFVALFLAVSGTATAAHLITGRQIARNAITGKHVRDHSLSAADFRGSLAGPAGPAGLEGPRGFTGAKGERGPQGDRGEQGERGLPGKDGKDGSNGHDGKDGAAGNDGKDGAPGPQGKQGDPGKDGENGKDGRDGHDGRDGKDGKDGGAGAPGFNGVTVVQRSFSVPPSSHGTNATATCQAPTPKVVGGGYFAEERLADFSQLYSTYPDSGNSWSVRVGNAGNAQTISATVYAMCVAG